MNPAAGIGFVGMLAALGWCTWSLVRVIIGPARKKAIGRVGLSLLAFLVSALVMGWNLAPSARLNASAPELAVSTEQQEIARAPRPTVSTLAVPPPPELRISERFQVSPTMVSVVVAGFIHGEENRVAELARAECHAADFCSVGIWTDTDLAPRKLKMTDEQMAGRLGHYVHNSKTRLDHVLWNCKRYSHRASECLP